MDRGFLSGLAAGLVLVVGGGIVVSELAPPPGASRGVEPGAEAPVSAAPATLPTGEAAKPAGIEGALETAAPAGAADPSAPIPEPATAPTPETPTPETPAPEVPVPVSPLPQAKAPIAAAPAVAAATLADTAPAPAEPVAAEPLVPTGEPATIKTPAATAEPLAPKAGEAVADVAALIPPTPAPPAADKVQPAQQAPEKVPQPSVTDAAATLAKAAAAEESALPVAGTAVESPQPLLPGVVALPASDDPALTPAPAAKPAVAQQTGAAPTTGAPDLATHIAVGADPTASIGDRAREPQPPGADPAPDSIADPAPLPAEPVAGDPETIPAEGAGATAKPAPVAEVRPGILARTDSGMPKGANAPKPGFGTEAPGVRIIRPSTTKPPATKPLPAARAAAAAAAQDVADGSPALVRNAADFANPEGKPLMSVILIDDGSQDPARITGLGFPVSVALDPTRPGAAEAAAIYRAAGLEVLILATAVPAGATASDLEVTFQSHFNALPQAVGVLDLPLDGFQDNRVLAQEVIGILGQGGYGLVTIDKGLNPAAQVAERERLAQARVFRELDAAGETLTTIRRILDRAAFRGAQQGSVVVLGHATDETLRALVEWAAEGRAANMALCPVSAAMSGV